MQNCYSKMELVIKGTTKLLGNYKAGNISKEIRKLKEEDSSKLKAYNAQLKIWVNDLQVTMKAQDEETRQLWAMTEDIERIWEFIGHRGDVVIKAHLFDNEVKIEDHLSVQKIITILVKYGHKMEATLREIQKLLPGSFVAGMSQIPTQAIVLPSSKGLVQQLLDDLRGRLRECKVQEAIATVAKIVVPIPKDSLTAVPGVTLKGKYKKRSRNPEP